MPHFTSVTNVAVRLYCEPVMSCSSTGLRLVPIYAMQLLADQSIKRNHTVNKKSAQIHELIFLTLTVRSMASSRSEPEMEFVVDSTPQTSSFATENLSSVSAIFVRRIKQ
ncbi:hypothetical protein POUND7_018341 [Theobroma cacao]